MNASHQNNPLNILNDLSLDEPIYRYMKLTHFEEALRTEQLIFVNPTLWDDPYELIPENIWTNVETVRAEFNHA